MSAPHKPHKISILFHWIVAALILLLFPLGVYMAKTHSLQYYDLHKSLGVIAYILIVLRLIWIYRNGEIRSLSQNPLEKAMAKIVHRLMLGLSFFAPLFGMLYSTAAGYGFGIFAWRIVPVNLIDDKVVPLSLSLKPILLLVHEVTSYLMMFIVLGHIAAALKHHFFDKDETLIRMLKVK